MKPLSPAGALFCALFNTETRAYPSYEGRRLEPGEIASSIRKELAKVTTAEVIEPGFSGLLAKARESLAEAKSQTEYQDQKIARLLTIVAFVTAAAGTIFSKVVDSYPINHATPWVHWDILVYGAYLFFFVFVLLVGSGALISFHATRSRFVWDTTQGNLVQRDKKPTSLLFFQESIRTTPANWASPFSSVTADGTNPELMLESYKGYVIESYLVNAKIADKLRMLEPAQALLSYAIRFLLIWLVLVLLLFVFVDRPGKLDQTVPTTAPAVGDAQGAVVPSAPSAPSGEHADIGRQEIVVNCTVPVPTPSATLPPIKHQTTHVCNGQAARASESIGTLTR